MKISLVIPVFNEQHTISDLIYSIKNQTIQPDEIILVDGGSTDNTIQMAKNLTGNDSRFLIIAAGRAMPGKGRNIGAQQAANEWIAFTDAGIKAERYWLQNLIEKENLQPDIIYGNVAPQINSFFDKCAAITYVPPQRPGKIRSKSIASILLKKEIWKDAGGFPDWRAAEDLIFMENIEKPDVVISFAPNAMVYWQLRPDLNSTYKKFVLYSKYNVWAKRQAFWHYGIARQYAIMLVAVILAIFHSWYWVLLLPLWIGARAIKRMISHRHEFGISSIFNPAIFFMVILITLTIDAATFIGWLQALLTKPSVAKASAVK